MTRSGTLEAGCVSLRRGDAQSPHYARRFTLGVAAASTATISASSSADVFVYVLSGSGGNVTVEGSDDDSGAGTDAEVTGVALAAGTTALDEPPVVITGLADAAVTGRGTLTAAGTFTVEPADAVCTAAAAGGVTPSVTKTATPAERTVSLTLAAPFSHRVTVTCDAPRRMVFPGFRAGVLLEGHSQDGAGAVAGRDNNSGPRNGARLTGVRLAPGDYTIEATTAKKRRTGDYDLRVDAQLDVLITNLNGRPSSAPPPAPPPTISPLSRPTRGGS